MISFKGAHFPQDIILMGIRWYLAYPLSYRHVEELLEERRANRVRTLWLIVIFGEPGLNRPSEGVDVQGRSGALTVSNAIAGESASHATRRWGMRANVVSRFWSPLPRDS